jgi:hypothetical protein
MVQNKALAGMQGCDFLRVSNRPEKVTVTFRAAVLSVMCQGQTQESLFGAHCDFIDCRCDERLGLGQATQVKLS